MRWLIETSARLFGGEDNGNTARGGERFIMSLELSKQERPLSATFVPA